MEKFPKFIIQGEKLILGKVKYHKDLIQGQDPVIGGGWFAFKPEQNTFLFIGESHDFGPATFESIKSRVENGMVFNGRRNISKDHLFRYDNKTETIDLKVIA